MTEQSCRPLSSARLSFVRAAPTITPLGSAAGRKDVCVYFKHEVCVTERTVNSQLDISDIELQTSAGLHFLLLVTAL